MAAARSDHKLLVAGGLAAAAYGAYRFIYQPWHLAQLTATASGGGALPLFPGVSMPTTLPPTNNAGQQGSIIDPRVSPGGPVGYAMWKKGWTQQAAQARLDKILAAARGAVQTLAQLRSATNVNPAAVGIPASQLALAQNVTALANATAQLAAAQQRGDALGANEWGAAVAGHQQNIRELQARIAAASAAPDNSLAIAAYEGGLANQKSDWFDLTGQQLVV